jgi:GNAT superfamily N-acetyltransferase
MSIIIREERVNEIWDDIQPLIRQHWEEIAHNKDKIPLDPDKNLYLGMEAQDCIIILSARQDTRLVGYCVTFLVKAAHYVSSRQAAVDVLYLVPEARTGGAGIKMLQETERLAQERGCTWMTVHFKPEYSLAPLLRRLCYNDYEITMAKVLKE